MSDREQIGTQIDTEHMQAKYKQEIREMAIQRAISFTAILASAGGIYGTDKLFFSAGKQHYIETVSPAESIEHPYDLTPDLLVSAGGGLLTGVATYVLLKRRFLRKQRDE